MKYRPNYLIRLQSCTHVPNAMTGTNEPMLLGSPEIDFEGWDDIDVEGFSMPPLKLPDGAAAGQMPTVLVDSRTDSHSFANLRTYEWEIINTRKYSKIRVFLRMYFIRSSALLVASLPPHFAAVTRLWD